MKSIMGFSFKRGLCVFKDDDTARPATAPSKREGSPANVPESAEEKFVFNQ
jgi:hypothetical protein